MLRNKRTNKETNSPKQLMLSICQANGATLRQPNERPAEKNASGDGVQGNQKVDAILAAVGSMKT